MKNGDLTAAIQPGSILGLEAIASHSWEFFRFNLQIVSGTRGYAHASGTLKLSYTSTWTFGYTFDDGVLVVISEINDSGTLTGSVH